MRFATAAVVAAVLGGCGIRTDELAPPFFHAEGSSGLCGWNAALDGAGDVWSEHGCENGAIILSRVRRATAAELQGVQDAFAALPAPTEGCVTGVPTHDRIVLRHVRADLERAWTLCVNLDEAVEEPWRAPLNWLVALADF